MKWLNTLTAAILVTNQPPPNNKLPPPRDRGKDSQHSSNNQKTTELQKKWKYDVTCKGSSSEINSFLRRDDPDPDDSPSLFAKPLHTDALSPPWQQPAFYAFAQNQSTLACIPNAFALTRIAAWKQDVLALQALKFGGKAGVANNGGKEHTNTSIRTGVHQIWLQSPSSSMHGTSFLVGNLDARRDLQNAVNDLRKNLVLQTIADVTADPQRHEQQRHQTKWDLPENLVELSYLVYDGRNHARYGKHVDAFKKCTTTQRAKGYERCVSFLIYLGDGFDNKQAESPSSSWYPYLEEEECDGGDSGGTTIGLSTSRPWDCQRDGGALRIHGKASEYVLPDISRTAIPDEEASSPGQRDIVPEAGTLVIFDSSTVEHEVMPTFRDRLCIVGWFNTPVYDA